MNGALKEESKEKTDEDEDSNKVTEPMVGKGESQWELVEPSIKEQAAEEVSVLSGFLCSLYLVCRSILNLCLKTVCRLDLQHLI